VMARACRANASGGTNRNANQHIEDRHRETTAGEMAISRNGGSPGKYGAPGDPRKPISKKLAKTNKPAATARLHETPMARRNLRVFK